MVTALAHLSESDRKRIHDAIAEVERRSHGHFALAVVPASDRYLLFPLVWAAMLALVVGGVIAAVWPDFGLRDGVAIQAGVFVVASLVFDWMPLRLMLVPRKHKHAQARILAHREFAAHILADPAHRSGVVFFVSLAERYVEVVADRRLHDAVDGAAWQQIVDAFIAAVQAGRIADGFVAGVSACGAVLERHLPKA